MEESILYNLLESTLLCKWRKQAGENDDCGFAQIEKDIKKELAAANEKSNALLNSYALAVEDRIDYLYLNLNIKILNLGIKIGMELQKAFAEQE